MTGFGNFQIAPQWSAIKGKPDLYTETEIDSLLAGKSDVTHNHTLTSLSEKSYNSLTDKPTIPTQSYIIAMAIALG